jgi:Ca2+-binding EF-hand superfamily protein
MPTASALSLEDTGFVDPEELMAAAVRSSVYLRQRHLEEVFRRFDLSGDGKIDLEELRRALRSEDAGWDAEDVMRDADADGDGHISFEEFSKVMSSNKPDQ